MSRLKNINLEGKNLNFSSLLAGQVISGSCFFDSKLQHADLNYVKAVNTDFTNANMSSSKMKKSRAIRSVFRYTILDDADLEGTNFYLSDFTGANFVATNLRNCDLSHCCFAEAILAADLRGATTNGVDFRDVLIEHCTFDKNTFNGAILTEVQRAWVNAMLEAQVIFGLTNKANKDILEIVDANQELNP